MDFGATAGTSGPLHCVGRAPEILDGLVAGLSATMPVELDGSYFHDLSLGARGRHRQAILSQPIDVKLDRFTNQAQHLRAGLSNCNTTREIRNMRPPARIAPLDYDHVPHHPSPPAFLRPACLRIAFNVPTGTSKLGLPATVTVPCLFGFLY